MSLQPQEQLLLPQKQPQPQLQLQLPPQPQLFPQPLQQHQRLLEPPQLLLLPQPQQQQRMMRTMIHRQESLVPLLKHMMKHTSL